MKLLALLLVSFEVLLILEAYQVSARYLFTRPPPRVHRRARSTVLACEGLWKGKVNYRVNIGQSTTFVDGSVCQKCQCVKTDDDAAELNCVSSCTQDLPSAPKIGRIVPVSKVILSKLYPPPAPAAGTVKPPVPVRINAIPVGRQSSKANKPSPVGSESKLPTVTKGHETDS